MDLQHVKQIIEERYGQLSQSLIERMRETPDEATGLSLWQALVAASQREEPGSVEPFETATLPLARELITPLSETECRVLWLGSRGYAKWLGGRSYDIPAKDMLVDDILEELFAWVVQTAGDLGEAD